MDTSSTSLSSPDMATRLNSIAYPEDATGEEWPIIENQDPDHPSPPKKRRLNRVITACGTCRKLKTRCESLSGKKSCRRCTSLRITCDLPTLNGENDIETDSSSNDVHSRLFRIEQILEDQRFQNATTANDVATRLTRIERTLEDLSSWLRINNHRTQAPTSPNKTVPESDTPESITSSGSKSKPVNGVTRPVLLLRNLQTQFFGPKKDFSDEVLALGSVVSAGIIEPFLARQLIQLFIKHYGMWISIEHVNDLPTDLEQQYPLLFSTACLLASRFVPSISKDVGHEMYLMVRRLAASVVLKPPPLDYEDLQSLLLLSMFSPTMQTAMPIDSWLMSALAMNHASLPLNISGTESAESEYSDYQLKRLRIWNALCLTHIQFSIGNGRQSMVPRRFMEHCSRILDFPNARCEDARLSAEVQLYWRTENILSHNLQLQEGEALVFDELAEWKSSWDHIFNNPDCITIKFGYYFCYLLLYRVSFRNQASSTILKEAALKTSSDILEVFLGLEFSVILDMPDYFFFIIAYAALTLCKFTIGDPLIAATQACLRDLAPNDEHIAFRFGTVLAEIRRKAAAAGTLSETQPNEFIQVADSLMANDNAWDVFMAGCYTHMVSEHLDTSR